jgi:hypothetical protein
MQTMRKNALENYPWSVQVSYFTNLLTLTFYSACYWRLFPSKKKTSRKVKIELSSGDEDETIEIKPKIEPCCSSSLQN